MFKPIFLFFPAALLPNSGLWPLTRLRDDTHWTHLTLYVSSGWVIGTSQSPLPYHTQHSQETDIRTSDGILTHNLSKRAAADPGLRPRGHWGRRLSLYYRRNLASGWLNNTKLCFYRSHIQYYKRYFSFCAAALFGLWPPHSWGLLVTHNDAPQSVGLLWMSDQLVAEASTWQHTTLTTEKHSCLWRDSNPESQ